MQLSFFNYFYKITQLKFWTGLCLCIILTDVYLIYVELPITIRQRCLDESMVPIMRAPILILGASVLSNSKPSQLLQARLSTGLRLFNAGKGNWFLVSGDNRKSNYNEPKVMKKWLLKHGVPKELIISDMGGERTYDSLNRAKMIFGATKIIIVTSDFHLTRAMFLAKGLGLDAYGVTASTKVLPLSRFFYLCTREYIARHRAVWDLYFSPNYFFGYKKIITHK